MNEYQIAYKGWIAVVDAETPEKAAGKAIDDFKLIDAKLLGTDTPGVYNVQLPDDSNPLPDHIEVW